MVQVFDVSSLAGGDAPDEVSGGVALDGFDTAGEPVRVVLRGSLAAALDSSAPWSRDDGPRGRHVATCHGGYGPDPAGGRAVFLADTVAFATADEAGAAVALSASSRLAKAGEGLSARVRAQGIDVAELKDVVREALRGLGDVAFALYGDVETPGVTRDPVGPDAPDGTGP